jgi:hypothetical protein
MKRTQVEILHDWQVMQNDYNCDVPPITVAAALLEVDADIIHQLVDYPNRKFTVRIRRRKKK